MKRFRCLCKGSLFRFYIDDKGEKFESIVCKKCGRVYGNIKMELVANNKIKI